MESSEDIELINLAIQKLLEETSMTDISGEKPFGNDDNQLLSRLFSQLESLKDGKLKQSEPEELNSRKGDGVKAEAKSENGSGCGGIGVEELRKEIKELKKQNTITHCLVSVMIVITLFWQASEASLLLKVKDGFAHPFSSFGSWLVNKVKRPTKQQNNHLIEHSGHSVQIPELPHVEFPHLGSSGEGH
ncbi:Nuclear transport factor 2B [Hibiscus syriacus]|uniref:Nuclear transport factor 2B n=1 Tax=Hibiscus syriacus TaxID=106335 RepID=A0A6A3CNP6_HIBSY|nr:uncharacterized protein LOC120170358 [Hibiscus syriacus]KAE8730124.1 Nuclear transport factor 2B [Hibiscus syriacus]